MQNIIQCIKTHKNTQELLRHVETRTTFMKTHKTICKPYENI